MAPDGTRALLLQLQRSRVFGPLQLLQLPVESYMSFMPLTVILIIISFPSLTISFIPDLKLSFSLNPSHCSLSFFRTDYMIPRLLLLLLSISVFLLLSFSVLHFLVVGSVR